MVEPDRQASTALSTSRAVLVLGAGTMGCGIAEVAATAGHPVYLHDANPQAVVAGLERIASSLARAVTRGRLGREQAATIRERISAWDPGPAGSLVGMVIEVIAEQLEAKIELLRAIEPQVRDDTILASNTSSLSISAIGAALRCPRRFAGMHFFNPATMLPLVEVVRGQATDMGVLETIEHTARAWGKSPVLCDSSPGFIVNRVARPFYGEALRSLQERATDPATLDAVMREAGGFRMGPCELMDLIGHDVNLAVTRSVHQGFFGHARYRPSPVQQALVDAGWLGRKSGRGFFDHAAGASLAQPHSLPASDAHPARIEFDASSAALAPLVEMLRAHAGIAISPGAPADLLRVNGRALALTDGRSAAQRSVDAGEPVIVFDLALDLRTASRVALAAPGAASAEHLAQVSGMFQLLGKSVSLVDDIPGLLVARTVAMLVNEALDAQHQALATEEDIDLAMRLGVNYPIGPLAWGERVGHGYVLGLLDHLARTCGAERYAASPLLRRKALENAHA